MTLHFALPWAQPLNADGDLLPGATLEFYAQGTTTPIVVYTNASRSVAHTWPVEANASGRFPAIFLPEGNYDVVLKDAEGVEVARASGLEGTSGNASSNGSGSLSSIGRKVPVGSILFHSLAEVPAGFIRIKKNKQSLQKSAYPELSAKYALYSYPYGSTSETFNIPGGAGLFPRIWDDTSTWDPDATGRFANDTFATAVGNVIGSFQSSANLSHQHGPGTQTTSTTLTGTASGSATSTVNNIVQSNSTVTAAAGSGATAPPYTVGSVVSNVTVALSGTFAGTVNGGATATSGGNESRGANIALPFIMFVDPSGAAAEETPALGLPYRFDTSTTDSDPGTGELRLNAVPASATFLYISKTDLNSVSANALWTTLDSISGSNRGVITISSVTSLGNTAIFKVTGSVTDATSYWKVPIEHLGGTPTFGSGNLLSLNLSYGGLQGSTGAAGAAGTNGANGAAGADGISAGRRWLFASTTTMADPATSNVRLNNATAASVTAMAISYTSAEPGTPSLADWVKAWDDSTTPTDRGTVIISQISDATKQAIFRISGDLTDNTTWAEVPLVYQSGPGGFTAGAALSVQWSRTGNKGSDGVGAGDVVGPASAVSGRMVEFDGTTGKLIRDGGVVVSSFAKTILDDTTAAAVRATIAAAPDFPWMPQGRLTLSTATPVMTGNVSGATTVYYTPFRGRAVPLWNGSTFVMTDTGGELSQATTDTTKSPAAVTTNSNYDYFVWSDSGTIRCTRGPAWSSSTSRGTGAGTTELEMVNGFWVNKVAITNGPAARYGLYVGSVRSNASSQIDWSLGGTAAGGTAAVLGVFNAYNQMDFFPLVQDSTSSWSYNSTTWRSARAQDTMRISVIDGLGWLSTETKYQCHMSGGASGDANLGIGLDSTSTPTGIRSYFSIGTNTGTTAAAYAGTIGLGWHYLQALERQTTTASSATFFSNNSGGYGGLFGSFCI